MRGDEKPELVDIDADEDSDAFIMIGRSLYFKENYKNVIETPQTQDFPLTLSVEDNPFFNGNSYYESINSFIPQSVQDGKINLQFQRPSYAHNDLYRLRFHEKIAHAHSVTP